MLRQHGRSGEQEIMGSYTKIHCYGAPIIHQFSPQSPGKPAHQQPGANEDTSRGVFWSAGACRASRLHWCSALTARKTDRPWSYSAPADASSGKLLGSLALDCSAGKPTATGPPRQRQQQERARRSTRKPRMRCWHVRLTTAAVRGCTSECVFVLEGQHCRRGG